MGEATYYLKARFKGEQAAKEALPLVAAFLTQTGKAQDWWQKNRGNADGKKFWKDFEKLFPLTADYVKTVTAPTYDKKTFKRTGEKPVWGRDHNNGLAGVISFGTPEHDSVEDVLRLDGEVLCYCELTWHLASWTKLCRFLEAKYKAVKADWVSDEYTDPFDSIAV